MNPFDPVQKHCDLLSHPLDLESKSSGFWLQSDIFKSRIHWILTSKWKILAGIQWIPGWNPLDSASEMNHPGAERNAPKMDLNAAIDKSADRVDNHAASIVGESVANL